ncbi:MAG TPA: S41 family peptidase [Candidatus Saccharimonadales bacterium]|nr:S41 family peptidase [Candidatus Saccharimonadales bacterium]
MRLRKKKVEGDEPVRVKSGLTGLLKGVLFGVIIVLVFGLGVNIGNGRIHFGKSGQNGLPNQLDYSSVNTVYQALKENYNGKLTEQQLVNGMKHGLAEATNDPYTVYFTPSEAKQFQGELNNTFSGIGAELGQDSDKNIIVISPISGFPADKAGLKPQDIIATINGQSTAGMSVDEAVGKIRGPAGTTVKLGIVRDKTQTLTLSIIRQDIQVPSVTTKVLDGNIGYMHISTFSDDTANLAQQAADKFKQQGVRGIVLDLRGDPGGLLDAALKVSSLWVPEGKLIVSERGTIGTDDHFATGGNELGGIPTVVLIDGGSASASEITTGALHDNHEAYVMGQKSFGKGVVQQLINLGGGAELKVTVASWYRPDGQNINHHGITPDQAVKAGLNDTLGGTDAQLQAAEQYLAAH